MTFHHIITLIVTFHHQHAYTLHAAQVLVDKAGGRVGYVVSPRDHNHDTLKTDIYLVSSPSQWGSVDVRLMPPLCIPEAPHYRRLTDSPWVPSLSAPDSPSVLTRPLRLQVRWRGSSLAEELSAAETQKFMVRI